MRAAEHRHSLCPLSNEIPLAGVLSSVLIARLLALCKSKIVRQPSNIYGHSDECISSLVAEVDVIVK